MSEQFQAHSPEEEQRMEALKAELINLVDELSERDQSGGIAREFDIFFDENEEEAVAGSYLPAQNEAAERNRQDGEPKVWVGLSKVLNEDSVRIRTLEIDLDGKAITVEKIEPRKPNAKDLFPEPGLNQLFKDIDNLSSQESSVEDLEKMIEALRRAKSMPRG